MRIKTKEDRRDRIKLRIRKRVVGTTERPRFTVFRSVARVPDSQPIRNARPGDRYSTAICSGTSANQATAPRSNAGKERG